MFKKYVKKKLLSGMIYQYHFLKLKDYVYVSYAIIGILNFMSAYDIFIASIILDVKLPTNDFFEIHKD